VAQVARPHAYASSLRQSGKKIKADRNNFLYIKKHVNEKT